jgi:hypothetical protein
MNFETTAAKLANELEAYLKYCDDKSLIPSSGVVIQMVLEAGNDNNHNGDTSARQGKSNYRVNGCATQAEDRHLKKRDRDDKYEINGNTVTPKQKYKELKALFDKDGWRAFDKDETTLFDDLTAVSGDNFRDVKDAASAAELKLEQDNLKRCYLDRFGESDRIESTPYIRLVKARLGRNVAVFGDGITMLKCFSGEVWHDAFSTPIGFAWPPQHQAILNVWRMTFPEKEFPDSRTDGTGIIPEPWTKPHKNSATRHASDSEELAVLLHYRNNQTSNEPMQTNFFHGSNDNFAKVSDAGDTVAPSQGRVEGEWEMRPSENEMLSRITGAQFDAAVEPRDPTGRYVNQNPKSRIVPMGGDIEYGQVNGLAESLPPVSRIGYLRFATHDHDRNNPESLFRGELIGYLSMNGKLHRVKDQAGTPYARGGPPAVTVLNSLFDKELGAKVSESNVVKLSVAERCENEQKAQARWTRLESELGLCHCTVRCLGGNRCRLYNYNSRRGSRLDALPPLPNPSMSLNAARLFCELELIPANDNAVRFGLPRFTVSASHLSMSADYLKENARTGKVAKVQTSASLLADSPEDILIRNEERRHFADALSKLSQDERDVLESASYAANYAQVGRETGDQGKSEKTQERNGQARIRQVTAKLSSILDGIAA